MGREGRPHSHTVSSLCDVKAAVWRLDERSLSHVNFRECHVADSERILSAKDMFEEINGERVLDKVFDMMGRAN